MKTIRIVLIGVGNVGKAFLHILAERAAEIEKKYDQRLLLCAAVDIGGAAVSSDTALPAAELLAHVQGGCTVETFGEYGRPGLTGEEAIKTLNLDALIETTPTNLNDGEPGWTHIRTALCEKMEVVSANKGPIVLFYDEVHRLARQHGCGLHISAATAAALPTLDVGQVCLAGTRVLSIEGLLNGTTNYVLTRMTQENCPYEDALRAAQELGIAETDPSKDVGGYDTAIKMVIITNRIFGTSFGINDIAIQGITDITPQDIEAAARENRVIKLVGSAERVNDDILMSVAPKQLNKDHPLASVNGSEKAISYMTDTMDRITVMGGKSSPVGAAAALLKDLINAYT